MSRIPAAAAIISPGSRNAPIIRTLTSANIPCYSVVDERSAAFMALGLSLALGEPVILSCTSGTAALNYYPAIAEAYYSRIPLIAITADRPQAAIDNWDGQAIRQKGLFNHHIRGSWSTPEDFSRDTAFATIGHEVLFTLKSSIPGPLHINIPIPEPLYNEPGPAEFNLPVWSLPIGKRVDSGELRSGLKLGNKKVLFFNGQFAPGEYVIGEDTRTELVLSDIVSHGENRFDYWDAFLFSMLDRKTELDHLRPDVLVTAGMGTVSKGLSHFLKYWNIEEHYHLSDYAEIGDPYDTKPIQVTHKSLGNSSMGSVTYVASWLEELGRFKDHKNGLDAADFHEMAAVEWVLKNIPSDALIHLGNSLPIRYASYLGNGSGRLYHSNRGTSGIDGCLSTALGYSLVYPSYVILGDISAQYDLNALLSIHLSAGIKVIVLNNEGGQIFRYLDGPSEYPDAFDFQITGHKRDFRLICEHFGLKYLCSDNFNTLSENWSGFENETGPVLLEIKTKPAINYEHYLRFKAYKHE